MNHRSGNGKNFLHSLRGRLLLAFMALALIPLGFVGGAAYWQSQQALNNRIVDELQNRGTGLAGTMADWLQERTDDMVVLAGTARVRTMDATKASDAVNQYFDQWGYYETIFAIQADGQTFYATDGQSYNLAQKDYFQRALNGEVVVTGPEKSSVSQEIVFGVAAPITVEGKNIGVVAGTISTNRVGQLLEKVWIGETGEAYLVNEAGYFITPARFASDLVQAGLINRQAELELKVTSLGAQRGLAGETGVADYQDFRGQRVLGAYVPVTGHKWALLVEQRYTEAFQALSSLQLLMGIIVLAVVLLVAVTAVQIATSLARPIARMAEVAQALAAGEIDQDVAYRSQDEIGELADSFRAMIAYQAKMGEAAWEIAQGNLEVEVVPHSESDVLGSAFAQMLVSLRESIGQVAQNTVRLNSTFKQLVNAAADARSTTTQIGNVSERVEKDAIQQMRAVEQTVDKVNRLAYIVKAVGLNVERQAAQMEQISEVVANFSRAINFVQSSAEAGAKSASEASQTSLVGAEAVDSTIFDMGTIKQKVDLSTRKVQDLGKRSEEISLILETIQDIASQTNLLAINAAIEAARSESGGRQTNIALIQEHLVSVAKILAAQIAAAGQIPGPAELEVLGHDIQIGAFSITDSDGVVVSSNHAGNLGFRFPETGNGQAVVFRPLLNTRDGLVVQPPKKRDQDGVEFVYVGVSRRDQPGIIQVGQPARTLDRFVDLSRGFAVVADEVRKLSERAAQSTSQIGNLIKGVQTTVKEASEAMISGGVEVDRGITTANYAGKSLKDILASAEAMSTQVNQIAERTKEMRSISSVLINSLETIVSMTRDNRLSAGDMLSTSAEVAVTVEKIARASEESRQASGAVVSSVDLIAQQVQEVTQIAGSVSQMAKDLDQVVNQFQLAAAEEEYRPQPIR